MGVIGIVRNRNSDSIKVAMGYLEVERLAMFDSGAETSCIEETAAIELMV
jgi:hypothetical protein